MLTAFMLTLAVATAAGPGPAAANVAVNDARLNDVCFVDAEHGWAVGDRGVIWHTDDGGRQWQPQASGVRCALSAVCFCDDQLGWAAGGFVHPFTHTSTGVLLVTRDGGKTWTPVPKLLLSAVKRLRFFDPQHGWAISCSSAMYPSGVFVTDDGGRQWRPVPGGNAADWLAGDFVNLHSGALAGRNGALGMVNRDEIEMARSERFVMPSYRQLRLTPPAYGWLVGDGGMVRMSVDRGATWQPTPGPLPIVAPLFDFAALAVRGAKCWIAGTPGTRVFHTSDGGRTWTAFATGAFVPLRAMQFVDDQHGWAVGELGTILATSDGGRTWQTQRAGGSQAALLGFFADPDDVPLELIARLGGNEGYLTAIDVIGRRDVELPAHDYVHLSHRLHEAVSLAGGSAAEMAWRFPLRQAGLAVDAKHILAAWDAVNNGRGREELQAYLVRQIRLWRPEVIVTSDLPGASRASEQSTAQNVTRASDHQQTSDELDSSLLTIVHQAVVQAVAEAADPNAFPAQIAEAGLAPWQVKKIYGMMPPGTRGGSDLATSQYAPRLGCSLADAAAEPRGLLFDHFTLSPVMIGFRLLHSVAGNEADRRDFFGGIALSPGGPARREMPPAGEGLDRRIAQRRRIVQAIIDRAEQAVASPEQLLARIDDMTRDLDDDSRARMLYQLADRYYHTGHWPLAAETFQVLAKRYPQHALAPAANLWLLQYYASGEAAWRVERGESPKRLERAEALAKEVERTRPEWFAEPAVCFPLAAAYRGLNQPRQADGLYQLQSHGSDRGACALRPRAS